MDPQTQVQTPVQDQQVVAEEQTQPVNDTKQQVVDTLVGSKNVLVTVGANPSVDELASALALTMLLNKVSKHVTAVFSGKVPSAMEFLDPEKTFEDSVDSLREFIIALDKEKADKLRYKVEDDVVKIFITPYQTVITEKDLQFSQGDFNVDAIVALGVRKREALDAAILAHGRILHDAQVVTITAGPKSDLGSIDWNEPEASSIAEMLVRVSEQLGPDLIDEPIGTALLTGIVAETNRFSNEKTSPSVMTIAAQLMAAGANQQLVATNLRQEGMISESIRTQKPSSAPSRDDGEMVLNHGKKDQSKNDQQKNDQKKPAEQKQSSQPATSEKNAIKKPFKPMLVPEKQPSKEQSIPAIADFQPKTPVQQAPQPELPSIETPTQTPEAAPVEETPLQESTTTISSVKPLSSDLDSVDTSAVNELLPPLEPVQTTPTPADEQPLPVVQPQKSPSITEPPTFGGTLNATVGEYEGEISGTASPQSGAQVFEHSNESSEQSTADAIEAARRAVEDAANEPVALEQPLAQPASIDFSPQPAPDSTVMAAQAAVIPPLAFSPTTEPSPVDDFMQPHAESGFASQNMNMPNMASAPSQVEPIGPPGLPPLPPMPGAPADGSLPPLPPMPGQPSDPSAGFQPPINPEFMQTVNQSQNHLTDAGAEMSQKYADANATRQDKIDELGSQYDSAVAKNRELQGLPPVNDHTTFPLPPPPQAR